MATAIKRQLKLNLVWYIILIIVSLSVIIYNRVQRFLYIQLNRDNDYIYEETIKYQFIHN